MNIFISTKVKYLILNYNKKPLNIHPSAQVSFHRVLCAALMCKSPPFQNRTVMTYIQGQVPNKSESETFIVLYRSRGVPIHSSKLQNMATCHEHRDPPATCPNSLKPLPEVNLVTFLHLHSKIPFIYCNTTGESVTYHYPTYPIRLC